MRAACCLFAKALFAYRNGFSRRALVRLACRTPLLLCATAVEPIRFRVPAFRRRLVCTLADTGCERLVCRESCFFIIISNALAITVTLTMLQCSNPSFAHH